MHNIRNYVYKKDKMIYNLERQQNVLPPTQKNAILEYCHILVYQVWPIIDKKKYKYLWYKINIIRLITKCIFIINWFEAINVNDIY
jgi:hypothetical protein